MEGTTARPPVTGATWIAGRTSRHVFGDRKKAFLSQIPLLLGMVLFSIFSLWLLKQPMEMRTSAM